MSREPGRRAQALTCDNTPVNVVRVFFGNTSTVDVCSVLHISNVSMALECLTKAHRCQALARNARRIVSVSSTMALR